MSKTKLRPVLRYFGGKFLLAPWIIGHMPKHRIYVEPFGGAASVLMQKPKSYAEVYNDLDDGVYSLFSVIRSPEQSAQLYAQLRETPFSRREFEMAAYYHPDPVEKARRLIVRSYMGFGADSGIDRTKASGFRANSNRSGTTPAHDWANYAGYVPIFSERLRGVVIENRDAKEVMLAHDGEETLHYLDPPYPAATRTKARAKNYNFELSDEEHEDLLAFALKLRGMVMISSYESELYDRMLTGWKKEIKDTHADGANKRKEVLWIKPAPTNPTADVKE